MAEISNNMKCYTLDSCLAEAVFKGGTEGKYKNDEAKNAVLLAPLSNPHPRHA